MVHLFPTWDPFLVSGQQANFEANVSLIVGFHGTPQWNVYSTWNLEFGVYGYLNTWAATDVSYAVYQNDSDAAPLYNPFASNERRAMDLKSSTFRAGFVARCIEIIDAGGAGVFFDDCNLAYTRMFKRANGDDPLTNFDTGTFYTSVATGQTGWAALLGDFYKYVTDTVKAARPQAKFVMNTVWTDLGTTGRWTDPRWANLVQNTDWIILEHGSADTGLTAGAGAVGTDFNLRSQNLWIDAVHALGKNVLIYADSTSTDTRKYEVARFLDKQDRTMALPDMIGIGGEVGSWPAYDPIFNTDLGDRLGRFDPNVTNGIITARHEGGASSYMPITFSSAQVMNSQPPVMLDDFERADSAGSLGSNWTSGIHTSWNSWSIVGGKAVTNSVNFKSNYWNVTQFPADQWVEARLAPSGLFPRLVARVQNMGASPNYYEVSYAPATPALFIVRTVAGARTQIGGNIQAGLAPGDRVRLTVNGTTLNLYVNGMLIATRTDSNITGAGYIGFVAPSASDFQLSEFAGGPMHPVSQDISITNPGNVTTLNWTASKTQAWLTISPTSGTTDAETDTITATVDPTGLAPGVYNDTITITDASATNNPQTIPVTFNVTDTIAPSPSASIETSRISRVVGKDAIDVAFIADENFVEYEVRRVSSASDGRGAGSQVETSTVSSRSNHLVTITDDELVAASASEGSNLLKVFVKDASGNWST